MEIRTKLHEEKRERHSMLHYLQSMKPSNSRHNIVPGETEARDEAIRQHLLVGRLKYNEKLPGDGGRFGMVGGEGDSTASGRGVVGPAAAARRYRDAELSDQGLSEPEAMDALNSGREEYASRGVPQLLSDQASGLAGASSRLGSARNRAV